MSAQTVAYIDQLLKCCHGSKSAELKLKAFYHVFTSNSPYEIVRAGVPELEDSSPVETFRAYFLGIVFGGVCSALNQVKSIAG